MNMESTCFEHSDGVAAPAGPGHPTPRRTAPAVAEESLAELAQQLQALIEAPEEIRRQLCAIGLGEGYQPEEFRCRLMQAGLSYSLASELKTVLQAKEQCRAFLKAPGEAGRQSWVATLAAARAGLAQEKYQLTAADQLAARVAGLFHKTRRRTVAHAAGVLTLELRPGELFDLLTSAPTSNPN